MTYGNVSEVKNILEINESTYDAVITSFLGYANVWIETKVHVTLPTDVLDMATEFYTAYLYRSRAETLSPMGDLQGVSKEWKEIANSLITDSLDDNQMANIYELRKVNKNLTQIDDESI